MSIKEEIKRFNEGTRKTSKELQKLHLVRKHALYSTEYNNLRLKMLKEDVDECKIPSKFTFS